MQENNIFIVSAPSGTGKSSLLNALIQNKLLNNIKISISYTTRKIRSNEKFGTHYYFITKEKFEKMIKKNIFIEYTKNFDDYYGTAQDNIKSTIYSGMNIILNIDWKGAKQIRNKLPKICSIFVLPPSTKELERRLRMRNQDNEEIIYKRMKHAINEINHLEEYDYLIINDDFDTTLFNLQTIILAQTFRLKYHKQNYKKIIQELSKK